MSSIVLAVVGLILSISLFSSVYAITDNRYVTGTATAANGVRVVKMLALNGAVSQLSIIFSANGVYASQSATIKASIDNSTWFTVDTVSLSTGTSLGKYYSDTNKATTIPVNIAVFPYLNITTPAIASRIQTITWAGSR